MTEMRPHYRSRLDQEHICLREPLVVADTTAGPFLFLYLLWPPSFLFLGDSPALRHFCLGQTSAERLWRVGPETS